MVNTTATAVPKVVAPDTLEVWQAILAYNNNLSNFAKGTPWTDATKGVVIHKITAEQAQIVASQVKEQAPKAGLPYLFTLGCIAIESTLDPLCVNGNLGPGESNVANDPGGYDTGLCQLKLKYLVPKPCATVEEARAFALDPVRAIPYHVSIMAGNVLWMQNWIENNDSSAPDPRFLDPAAGPLLGGTLAYNFGRTGALTYLENGSFPSHCQQVLDLTNYFAAKTGQTSPFAGLLG